MASYPSFPQLVGTSFNRDDGSTLKRSSSGRPRIRRKYSKLWGVGRIIHELDQADLDTLIAFYNANKNTAFDFTYAANSQSYSCQFVRIPDASPKAGGYYDVIVDIVEDI